PRDIERHARLLDQFRQNRRPQRAGIAGVSALFGRRTDADDCHRRNFRKARSRDGAAGWPGSAERAAIGPVSLVMEMSPESIALDSSRRCPGVRFAPSGLRAVLVEV